MLHRSTKLPLRFGFAAAIWLASIASAIAQQYMELPPRSVMGNMKFTSNPGSTVTLTDLAAALSGVGLVLPNATLQASPANPTATTSTTGVMMGLGSSCKITPAYSGRVRFEINGSSQSNGANTVSILGKFGTGAAPTNGTAATGASLGATRQNTSAANGNSLAFTINGIATGLTAGTQYWFDVDVLGSAGTSTVQNLDCNAMEF